MLYTWEQMSYNDVECYNIALNKIMMEAST